MFYQYIIYSSTTDTYYKGMTSNVSNRLREHNEGKSRYTKLKGPWILVYQRKFDKKKEALIEERRIKKLNRKSIEKLISETKDG